LCFALALLAPARGACAAPSPASPQLRASIDAAVEKERKIYGGRTPVPALLVGVWDGAGRSYVRGFGYADVALRQAPCQWQPKSPSFRVDGS